MNMIAVFSGFWEQCQARPALKIIIYQFLLLLLNVNTVCFYSQVQTILEGKIILHSMQIFYSIYSKNICTLECIGKCAAASCLPHFDLMTALLSFL